MEYRCEATTIEGFVQQLAVSYLRHGYWWYVAGKIPDQKNPSDVDARLIDKYGIDVSEPTRWRRKKLQKANMQYLRFERIFILVATKGNHQFYETEAKALRDIREVPFRAFGYSD